MLVVVEQIVFNQNIHKIKFLSDQYSSSFNGNFYFIGCSIKCVT